MAQVRIRYAPFFCILRTCAWVVRTRQESGASSKFGNKANSCLSNESLQILARPIKLLLRGNALDRYCLLAHPTRDASRALDLRLLNIYELARPIKCGQISFCDPKGHGGTTTTSLLVPTPNHRKTSPVLLGIEQPRYKQFWYDQNLNHCQMHGGNTTPSNQKVAHVRSKEPGRSERLTRPSE